MERRVAITGLGAVTPVGNDVESTWKSLVDGRSGVGPITTFDPSSYKVQIAGHVKNFDVSTYLANPDDAKYLSRAAAFGVAAAKQAIEDAGISPDLYSPYDSGMSIGSCVPRPEFQELGDILYTRHTSEGRQLVRQSAASVMARAQNSGMATMARTYRFQGPMISVSTACSASAHALGEAFRAIGEGDATLMLAGGYDALTTYLDVLGFSLLGALTSDYNDQPEKASRPFDRTRSGFVLGEGSVIVVLEEWEAAKNRGAHIYGEIVGYGSSMNAYRITDAPPDGSGVYLAMEAALRESGLSTNDVDYVVAHGTSTPGNDLCETNAIKRVFGDDAYRLVVSSPKSMTGHTTSAAAGLNLLAAVLAMRDGIVSPTINLENPDPQLDLDYVANEARPMQVRAAMVNAFAFGGTNGSLVVRNPAMMEA